MTGVTRTVLPNLLLGTTIYENSHCVTELRQITFENEILFVSFLHSRPPTSFPWFTSPLKALRHIIWGRYKWHILGFLLFLLFVSLIAFFIYAAPVSVTCQIAQSSNYCILKSMMTTLLRSSPKNFGDSPLTSLRFNPSHPNIRIYILHTFPQNLFHNQELLLLVIIS